MNTNCLKGVMCPECGHTEDFDIAVSTFARVDDDGAELARSADMEWDDKSAIWCKHCRHMGKVGDFKVPGFDVTFEIVSPDSAESGDTERRGWWMPGEWLFDVEDKPAELAFEFDPEHDFNEDVHLNPLHAAVSWAVSILKREGATHPSQSPSTHAEWWSTEPEVHSYETGEDITKSFHFVGFTDEQQREINRRMA